MKILIVNTYDIQGGAAARVAILLRLNDLKEYCSYNIANTPPPPLCNVQIGEVFL
jgi:hypothetical protein